MNTSRVMNLAKRVVNQMLADRRTLVLIVVVPIILVSFMSVLIRSDPSELTIVVVNEDVGFTAMSREVNLGDRLVKVLQDFDEFDVETMSPPQAQDELDKGAADAVIILPSDFTQRVIETQLLTLDVTFEGSNPMVAEQLDKFIERAALQSANSVAMLGSSPNSDMGLEARINANYIHGGSEYDTLDYLAPALVGFFVFLFVFLLTSISFLRERVAGTLERLQATPIRAPEIIVGYMLGFLVFGLLQGAITLLYTVFVINIHYAGNLLAVFLVETLLVIVSVNLGIFLSTFAQNEFQVLQFIPLVVITQGLLGGVVWQIEDMPEWLQPIATFMPLNYASDALRSVMIQGDSLMSVLDSLLILVIFAVGAVALSSWTAKRARI